jgi:hypothetical protein
MVRDFVKLVERHPGLLQWADGIAHHLGLDIPISVDPDYAVLFPSKEFDDWKEQERQIATAIQELAMRWKDLEPAWIVGRAAYLRDEALAAGKTWPNELPYLFREIASQSEHPTEWLQLLVGSRFSSQVVGPFFEKAMRHDSPDWIGCALECLKYKHQAPAVILLALSSAECPAELTAEALAHLDGMDWVIESLTTRKEITDAALQYLLGHAHGTILNAVIEGLWHAEPSHVIPESVYPLWRSMIIEMPRHDYLLDEIFKHDHEIAGAWLSNHLAPIAQENILLEQTPKIAIDVLTAHGRRELLLRLPERTVNAGLVASLIGDDLQLYREFLQQEKYHATHLFPLISDMDDSWVAKALLALESGYSVEDVVFATIDIVRSWEGNESSMWEGRKVRFSKLLDHPHQRIREVGHMGMGYCQNRQNKALEEEHNKSVFGRRRADF